MLTKTATGLVCSIFKIVSNQRGSCAKRYFLWHALICHQFRFVRPFISKPNQHLYFAYHPRYEGNAKADIDYLGIANVAEAAAAISRAAAKEPARNWSLSNDDNAKLFYWALDGPHERHVLSFWTFRMTTSRIFGFAGSFFVSTQFAPSQTFALSFQQTSI